jgi:molybdenum cofactor biosynthesis protein B
VSPVERIDPARPFVPVRIAVVVVSDTRTIETDTAGLLLADRLVGAGHVLVGREVIPDDRGRLEVRFRELIADPGVDIVLATGGTGITGRDVTPDALRAVWDKEIPGFGELFRYLSYASIGTSTMQSRATACVAGCTLLFALPGSRGACEDAWDGILRHQLDSRHRPCNLVELLPRLAER